MVTVVHPIHLGASVAFLLVGKDGPVLLDAGLAGSERLIWASLRRRGFRPADLRAVILTHSHLDHCGCVPALLRESGAVLAAHPLAAAGLGGGRFRVPRGRRLLGKAMQVAFSLAGPWLQSPQAELGVSLDDGAGLETLGLPGRVLYTPGHSKDSLTVFLADGRAFTGDLLERAGRRAVPQPYFVEDDAALAASIARLRQERPQSVYTSHWPHPLRFA